MLQLPLRAQAGLYTLLTLALLSAVNFLLDANQADRKTDGATGGTSGYIRRYDQLLRDLPPSEKTLGYWTDLKEDPGDLEFHVTQYALAPHVLVKQEPYTSRYVLGNLVTAPTDRDVAEKGLVKVRDYGAGVVLFERRSR